MAVFPMYMPPLAFDRLRTPQGKVAELRLELNSGGKKDKNYAIKKVALKRIVANMTMSNNDMVALFPDIIACMHIPSLEIKKMYDANTPSIGQAMSRLTSLGASYTWSTMLEYDRKLPSRPFRCWKM